MRVRYRLSRRCGCVIGGVQWAIDLGAYGRLVDWMCDWMSWGGHLVGWLLARSLTELPIGCMFVATSLGDYGQIVDCMANW